MNNEERLHQLELLKKQLTELDTHYESIKQSMGVDIEGPFWSCIFALVDSYINSVALATGIHQEDLSWMVYSNEWGARGFECLIKNGTSVIVTDIESFLLTV
jgi:hypothetical protein